MRRLSLKERTPWDPWAHHGAVARPPHADRPWVFLNMISSADGGATVDGLAGGLANPADKVVFAALRGAADVVLVGAATVRAEGYGPPRTPPRRRAARVARGQREWPRLAIVTASLGFDLDAPLFTEAPEPPLVVTIDDADGARLEAVGAVAEIITAGTGVVDLVFALKELRAHGETVLCEGGPSLAGQLFARDLIDELCLSLAPKVVVDAAPRIAVGPPLETPLALALDDVAEEDGMLFLRYLRDRS